MRTTLTLDADVERLLKEEIHRRRAPFKQVVNDAIRRGLSHAPAAKRTRYVSRPFDSGLVAGIDRSSLNRLNDELDDDARVRKLKR